MDPWWKTVIALFAGAAIGAGIMAGFAAHRAEEFVRVSQELLHKIGESTRDIQRLQAKRDLAILEALRRNRLEDAIAELEWKIETHISRYSGAKDATDEEAKLLADLRAYREDHPYHSESRGSAPPSSDPSQLLMTARVLPVFESGAMIGIRVSAIVPGSRWDALGVRNEDVITDVAGRRLDSPSSSAVLFELLAKDSDLSLIRDGPNQVRLLAPAKPE
jgi:hypothetical protein